MLERNQPMALFLEGLEGSAERGECKMACGVARYAPNPLVCAIDKASAGRDLNDFYPLPRPCPIVATVEQARRMGARALVLGIAPSGGRIPPEWLPHLDRAVATGLCLVNGLHDRLASRYHTLKADQWIWDIRREPTQLDIAKGLAANLNNRRLLMIGTDMAQGKMTAGLEIHRAALARGLRSVFIATGQIGMVITGGIGLPLDAIRVDYACGAVEQCMLDNADADLVVVEGQGSLLHPGSTANLPLLRGSCPTHLVLCHRASQKHLGRLPHIRIPPLPQVISLYQDLAHCCGCYPRPEAIGIALNTGHMTPDQAEQAVNNMRDKINLPVTDVLRYGVAELIARLLQET